MKKRRTGTPAFFISLAWANFFFLPEWLNLLVPANSWSMYEFHIRNNNAVASVLLVIAALACIHYAAVRFTKKSKNLHFAVQMIALALLFFPLNHIRDVFNLSQLLPWFSWKYTFGLLPQPIALALTGAIGCGGFYLVWRKQKRFFSGVNIFYALLIPFTLVTTFRSLGAYLNGDLSYQPRNAPMRPEATRPKGRVVWLTFDEMDYRLVFEQPPEILKAPALAKFAEDSVFFENAMPPGNATTVSIPSVTMGRTISSLVPQSISTVAVEFREGHPKAAEWGTAPTVFQSMSEIGANTALIGWFHGYCRLFGTLVQKCERASRIRYHYEISLKDNISTIVNRAFPMRWGQEVHIHAYNRLSQSTLEVVGDREYQFVFAHLPVPHPPYIVDPKTKKLSKWVKFDPSFYFSNVALADDLLAQIRSTMEANGTWDDTTVILTSDHHWRGSADFDGKTDERVPLLIKPAHSTKGEHVSAPVETLHLYNYVTRAAKAEAIPTRELTSILRAHKSHEHPTH